MNARIDDLNLAADPRNCAAATAPVLYLDNGEEVELPMKWAVCPVCDGKGSHVNPSIDAGGLSDDYWRDDPDFYADYMGGTFDVSCNRCNGRTTIPEVDWDALTTEQKDLYEAQMQGEADSQAERMAEIRMGC